MGLVFLHLLDGALVLLQVRQRGEPLDGLGGQVAVRHGVPDGHDLLAQRLQRGNHGPAGLALAAAGPDGAHRHHRLGRLDHGGVGADEPEVRALGEHARGLVHDHFVGHVAVSKDHLVDLVLVDELLQLALVVNGNPLRIQLPRQLPGILLAGDVRDLGGGEGDHLVLGVVAEAGVEVMKIAPGGAHDQHANLVSHVVLLVLFYFRPSSPVSWGAAPRFSSAGRSSE